MSTIWKSLTQCQSDIVKILNNNCKSIDEPDLSAFHLPDKGWINLVWCNESIRRAHIDVVDARQSKGLWMMHVCIFPQLTNNSPIYGFDVIAGKHKMTGAFHDFSPTTDINHPLILKFFDSVKHFKPSKSRNLPEWATNIFTNNMLAASNVKSEQEACDIINIAVTNLKLYVREIKSYNYTSDSDSVIKKQNYYCENQKKNPHTARVMKSLGLDDEMVDIFCNNMLFPQIYKSIKE